MNESILLAVFGCLTQWATASDADILALLNHQPGAELTSMELMYLGNIFDEMDANNDGLLEYADFERYMINDISHSTEANHICGIYAQLNASIPPLIITLNVQNMGTYGSLSCL